MKVLLSVVILCFAVWESNGYPYYPYYYGSNYDTLSYGASDSRQGGVVLSRYYNPYYSNPAVEGGMAAFMFRQPEDQSRHQQQQQQPSQYYQPNRRGQTPPNGNLLPPSQNDLYPSQQNEVYPQQTEKAIVTEITEFAESTEKIENLSTTKRTATTPASILEITESEIEEVEEPVQKPRKRVSKRKQVKRPEPSSDEEEEEYAGKMPPGTYFPMFFGWGGRSSGGAPGGATAIANAYSTGRGGVATSHATAYGPGPDTKYFKNLNPGN